jgi:hypothetical protein
LLKKPTMLKDKLEFESQTAILQTLNWGFKNRILKLHILKSLFLNHKPLLHKNRAFAGAQNALVKTKQTLEKFVN